MATTRTCSAVTLKSFRPARKLFWFLGFLLWAWMSAAVALGQSWIRVNHVGYLPDGVKVAVYASKDPEHRVESFSVHDAFTDKEIFRGPAKKQFGPYGPFLGGYRLDFSEVKTEGGYYIRANGSQSSVIRIDRYAYHGAADVLLQYMRQQRCGYNPFLRDSCHTQDGFIVYHQTDDSSHIDVTGGWHDASDYLQYAATSAHAIAQLLFAYRMHPASFADEYDERGHAGRNGIPDVLDEARWGLLWLEKMNPDSGVMFQQIADDRDHAGFRLPTLDPVTYGKGRERPVYFVTGKPQGMFAYTNASTGVSSIAGKFSAAFSLGSLVYADLDTGWSGSLATRAKQAYEFGLSAPGVSQTAPCNAPYFYEEGNWADDMQFASALLGELSTDVKYYSRSRAFGEQEAVTPWMGSDTARHYQWYPFVNLGRYVLGKHGDEEQRASAIAWMKEGIERVAKKAEGNMFQFGVPFIWCSNNLVSAMLTHLRLYRELSGDASYTGMEGSLLDWLFGVNPWGTSMIFGLPAWGDTPDDPHSAFTHHYGFPVDGGLVDGPVYASIFNGLIGLHLTKPDPYADFQSDLVVYHDDWGDYSTNEPTMDGTASLSYILASQQNDGMRNGGKNLYANAVVSRGGITRLDTSQKRVYLAFTGHEYAEGGDHIRNTLEAKRISASFFFTGDFYRDPRFEGLIRSLRSDGHYIGAHSDRHLLYASWTNQDSTLVTRQAWWTDILNNYREMARFDIASRDARFFMPPYEWYNDTIAAWTSGVGLRIVNFTSGTLTNADYTTPSMGQQYRSSDEIESRLFQIEERSGLNGHIILMHIGTHPEREDKFYTRLGSVIDRLDDLGYSFGSLKDFQ